MRDYSSTGREEEEICKLEHDCAAGLAGKQGTQTVPDVVFYAVSSVHSKIRVS